MKWAAPLLAGALLFSACSKKDDNSSSNEKSSNEASSDNRSSGGQTEATSAPASTAVPADGVDIAKSAQSAGFVYTFGKLTSGKGEYDQTSQTLSIDVAVENLGPDSSMPYPSLALEIGAKDDQESVSSSTTDFPSIPGNAKGKGKIQFELDADQLKKFSLDTAVLVIGSGNETRARVPLGKGGDLVDLKPVDQKPTLGVLSAGDWTFTPTASVIRWDNPDDHTQAGKGKSWYVVTMDVTGGTTFNCMYESDFSIKQPDGTSTNAKSLTAAKNASTCIDAGNTVKGFNLTFELDSPVKGDYSVNVKGSYGADGAQAEGTAVSVTLDESAKKTTG